MRLEDSIYKTNATGIYINTTFGGMSVLPKKPENKLYGLDHLRALAIMMVFFYHYQMPMFGHPEWLPEFSGFGWTGVDLFFVLSGFLIASQLFEEMKKTGVISFKTFFIKRFLRIMPAFWVVVGLYYFLPAFHEREKFLPVWRYLTFTQNLGLNVRTFGAFSHAWSLCVEEHFYLLLPVVIVCMGYCTAIKKWVVLLSAMLLTTIILRHQIWNNLHVDSDDFGVNWYQSIYYPTYTRLDGLVIGVAIAAFYQFAPDTWRRISKYGNLWLMMGLGLLTGAWFLCNDQFTYSASVWGFAVVALGYGAIVVGAISVDSLLYKWQSRVTTFLATISYSLYLTHKGVIHVTQNIAALWQIPVSGNVMMLICVVACVLSAYLLHVVVEKPVMWVRRWVVG